MSNSLLENPSNMQTSLTSEEEKNDETFLKSFPPGFRFKPRDEELVVHYLKPKLFDQRLPPNRIKEVQLYHYNPEFLSRVNETYGEGEWYFFTPRDKKYRNGTRPRRAAGDGYWKATGADRTLRSSKGGEVGYRKALVFYKGKPPKGVKTEWMMHEYRLKDPPPTRPTAPNSSHDMRLDDWVLCKIYKKSDKNMKASHGQQQDIGVENEDHELDSAIVVPPQSSSQNHLPFEEANNSLLPKQGFMHFSEQHGGNYMNGLAAATSCYDDGFMLLGQDSSLFMDNHFDHIVQEELTLPSFSSSSPLIPPLENLDQFTNNMHEEKLSSEFLDHHYPK